MKLVRVTAPALAEIASGARWYRDKSISVAGRFLAQVQQTFDLVEQFPDAGSTVPYLVDPDVRRFPVRGFPYQVVYVCHDDYVEVVAVAHDKRRPGYWLETQ